MQFLARLMDWALERREHAPPSSAPLRAIPGVRRSRLSNRAAHASDLHPAPEGKVSEVQRRQMTTVLSP